MDSSYAKELQTAIEVVRQAAALSQSILKSDDKGVTSKDDRSLVTIADFAIQALLTASIYHVFPNDGFIGEESADVLRQDGNLLDQVWQFLQQARPAADEGLCRLPASSDQMCDMIDWCGRGVPGGAGSGRKWVFDPIDGTQTFVQGQAYAINVALIEAGQQLLSVVGCPTCPVDAKAPIVNDTYDPKGQGLIVFAARGHGTYLRPLSVPSSEAQITKISAHAKQATLADLRSVTCYQTLVSGIDDAHKTIVERLGAPFPGCDLLGWVPRWVTLALGAANMTVWVYKRADRYAKIWDHAGAMLLFEELGGKVTDIDGKDIDLTVGRTLTMNHGFVAAPRHLHAHVLSVVHDVLKEQGKGHPPSQK